MAIHHSTPPLSGGERPRLASTQVGPVTQAIRAMRAAEPLEFPTNCRKLAVERVAQVAPPADLAIAAIEDGLDRHFAVPQGGAQFWHPVRALSRAEVEDLIGGLIDLLDAMDGDADRETEVLDASAAEWPGQGAHRFNVGEAA